MTKPVPLETTARLLPDPLAVPSSVYADLATFAQIVECGGINAAANHLGRKPTALSRDLRRLQETLHVQLMERWGKGLRPTPAGELIYQEARAIAAAGHNSVVAALGQGGDSLSGMVRISSPSALVRGIILPNLLSFRRDYPQVGLRLYVTDRGIDPFGDHVDFMLRSMEAPPEHMRVQALMPSRYVLCATPNYLSVYGTPMQPADLARHECLYMGESPGDDHWILVRGDEQVTVKVRGRLVVNHSECRLDGMLLDMGIACLPESVARRVLRNRVARRVLDEWELQSVYSGTAFLMSSPHRPLSPQARAFAEHLITNVRNAERDFALAMATY